MDINLVYKKHVIKFVIVPRGRLTVGSEFSSNQNKESDVSQTPSVYTPNIWKTNQEKLSLFRYEIWKDFIIQWVPIKETLCILIKKMTNIASLRNHKGNVRSDSKHGGMSDGQTQSQPVTVPAQRGWGHAPERDKV